MYSFFNKKLYFFNFSPWRMLLLKKFFQNSDREKFLCKDLEDALQKGLSPDGCQIFIFGIKSFPKVEKYAQENALKIYRVEDAFIRSVALGSSFSKPYSIVIDSKGIHYNPQKPSDLEDILQNKQFSKDLIERAKKLRKKIVDYKFSKYNHLEHKKIVIKEDSYDKVVLIPGQVEDDMSIKYGAFGLTNSDLIKLVREKNPDAFIIYKPHPDVLSGNRKGHIEQDNVYKLVDMVIKNISIDSAIEACDEVHTLTSGAGFDALLRGKRVFTYGMPFYAGWGLTIDHRKCKRRTRKLTLEELIAGCIILYPVYLSPKTEKFCEVEQTLDELKELQEKYFNNKLYKFKLDTKGFVFPKVRKVIKFFLR